MSALGPFALRVLAAAVHGGTWLRTDPFAWRPEAWRGARGIDVTP